MYKSQQEAAARHISSTADNGTCLSLVELSPLSAHASRPYDSGKVLERVYVK